MEHSLPIDLFHWGMAILPLVLLLIMLVALKWSGAVSGWTAFGVALLIALFLFRAPLSNVSVGFGKGLWEAFFILLVVWPALLLYQVTRESRSFLVIREGIQKHSKNYLFLVLAFGWVFASFLQGIAGFGAPIAVVAPLLIGIGVKPVIAVVIPLIGHAWANMMGTLAVGWIATINSVEIADQGLTLLYTGVLLWIPNILAGLIICWLFGKWKAIKEGFIAVIIISVIHGGGQLILTQVNPTLSNFIPATLALGALFLLARMDRYKEKSKLQDDTDILEDSSDSEEEEEKTPKMSLHKAFMPYYVLTGLSILMLGIPFIHDFLDQFEFGPPFPAIETGYGFEIEGEGSYSPIAPLTHPGLYLFISSIFAYFWYRKRELYNQDSTKNILSGVKGNAVGASLAIMGFLTMTEVMDSSGQTTVVALGIAEVSPPTVYVALASFLGVTGAFMTSSNTSSNVLFSPLHGSVVQSMDSLRMEQVIAAQSAGGAIGNSIAPANVILGTSTAGIKGKDSEVLKITLVFAMISTALVAGVSVLFHLFG
ncbi:L-lactate permease [Jeotgalibacillus proteolyticus]|uniref:L-lactate permease n=1 Tax=Jeotgalibacillus proteolyticus TaxID=2082395 RepID=A0A2S5G8F9_9BACL|nr:L-lactate permease [Jeotgalibacillus proteolyticus]PPA69276.1 L-lactate permease [Jeotgalibacillus proteolyticus]